MDKLLTLEQSDLVLLKYIETQLTEIRYDNQLANGPSTYDSEEDIDKYLDQDNNIDNFLQKTDCFIPSVQLYYENIIKPIENNSDELAKLSEQLDDKVNPEYKLFFNQKKQPDMQYVWSLSYMSIDDFILTIFGYDIFSKPYNPFNYVCDLNSSILSERDPIQHIKIPIYEKVRKIRNIIESNIIELSVLDENINFLDCCKLLEKKGYKLSSHLSYNKDDNKKEMHGSMKKSIFMFVGSVLIDAYGDLNNLTDKQLADDLSRYYPKDKEPDLKTLRKYRGEIIKIRKEFKLPLNKQ